MLARPTLKIAEIFASVQGEGLRQGEATIFIRLAGCNLRCSFCDTKYARKGGRDMTRKDVVEEVRTIRRGYPARWVCLTGGEPLLQDISGLLRDLRSDGFLAQVETNGTIDRMLSVDWYSVSPKPPAYSVQPRFLKAAKEVKLIVSRELSFDIVRKIRKDFPVEIPVFLQAESNRRQSMDRAVEILERGLKEGLEKLRLSLQLHKIFKIR